VYDITYEESEDSNPIIGLLPTSIEVKVKNHKSASKAVGWMGVFSTIYIIDSHNNTNTTLLQFMEKKYYYQSPMSEIIPGLKTMKNAKVKFVPFEKRILGYWCKKALIIPVKSSEKPVSVYYTPNFNIESSIIGKIYPEKINGFLFEFPLEMNGIKMRMKIKQIIPCSVSDEDFIIPDEFEKVSKEKMQEIIDSFI